MLDRAHNFFFNFGATRYTTKYLSYLYINFFYIVIDQCKINFYYFKLTLLSKIDKNIRF